MLYRLNEEVLGLEIAPTIEDVFHAETTSVEDYLAQVEESTLLATIQEAQQDAIQSFEGYMQQCMVRDWAANRRQLFGLIAPNVAAFGGPGSMPSGPQPLIGRSTQQGGLKMSDMGSLRLTPREQAYVEVVKCAAMAGPGKVDVLRELAVACKGECCHLSQRFIWTSFQADCNLILCSAGCTCCVMLFQVQPPALSLLVGPEYH